jgi:hypothetical protein
MKENEEKNKSGNYGRKRKRHRRDEEGNCAKRKRN